MRYVCAQMLSRVQLFVTPWTVACQSPLWNFLGKNIGVGCHFLFQAEGPNDLLCYANEWDYFLRHKRTIKDVK